MWPLAAVVATSAIAERFTATGYEYFNTAAGTNAAAAIGLAVLAVMRSEQRVAHAARVGRYWLSELARLQSRHALIGDVRGVGLFIGVEISQPGSTLPAADEATWLVNRVRAMEDTQAVEMHQHQYERKDGHATSSSPSSSASVVSGVLLSTDGPRQNVIKIKPPLCIEPADVDCMLRLFDRALTECEQLRDCGGLSLHTASR